ncbi:MAG: hypothetical protein GC152_10355 [Alphaproteobacteria bacterium]|nr:hypothetical protein [Alphaproteobacteria bacterium]
MSTALALFLLLSPEAPFQPAFDRPDALTRYSSTTAQYADCVSLISEDPAIAAEGARTWMFDGGGAPAMHCVAIADLALGRPRLAAVRLLELSERPDVGDTNARASVLGEAALAWIDAGEPGFAVEAAEAALATAPGRPDLSVVAAKAYAADEEWQQAADAVTAAADGGAATSETYLIRARAMRALGKNQAAAEDVVNSLSKDPFNLDALVMRGELIQAGIFIDANYRRTNDVAASASGQAANRPQAEDIGWAFTPAPEEKSGENGETARDAESPDLRD